MSEPAEQAAFERIVESLQHCCGVDFTAYRQASVLRRFHRRMDEVGVHSFEDYAGYLEAHADEFAALFDTVLINETRFFRDSAVWNALSETVIPALLASRLSDERVRVWCAGCASGEEAYSLAILFAEHLDLHTIGDRVAIYATDVDDEALAQAVRASYVETHLEDVSPFRRSRYFDWAGDRLTIKREIQRVVIFARHDLLRDAAISPVDLVMCRNTLMYFNAVRQDEVTARIRRSLSPGGFLILGQPEMLFGEVARFQPVNPRARIFRTF